MRPHVLTHVGDDTLLRSLDSLVGQERTALAAVLAHIAEVDARKLDLAAGFPSMFAYCVEKLRFSEDAAYKRIQASRAGRQFPAIFSAVEAGRLHLAAVCLLVPHLTPDNTTELLAAATHKTKSAVELLIAQRFPRTELPALVHKLRAPAPQLAPAHVETEATEVDTLQLGQVGALAGQQDHGAAISTVSTPTRVGVPEGR